MGEVDMAGSYTQACAKYGVEPAVELLVALRSGGDIECSLSHRIHPLADVAVEAVVEGLIGVKSDVCVLDLEGNAVTWKGAKVLTTIVEGSNMHTIKLGENALEDTGCKLIANCVATSRSVSKLDLRANRISGLGALAIGEMLRSNRSITHLSLQKNNIDDSGCSSIAEGIKGNHNIKHLSLRFNDIGDRGITDLVAAFKESSLTSLDLGGNRIGTPGAEALAGSLCEEWSTLSKVNLRSNAAGSTGVLAFASALQNPLCTLKELFIGFNSIPKGPAIELLGALRANKHLTKLDLQGVVLNEEGEGAVADLIACNHTLSQLVTELEASPDAGKLAADKLLGNTTLQELSVGDVEKSNNSSRLISLTLRCNKLLCAQHTDEGKRLAPTLIGERRAMHLPKQAWNAGYAAIVSTLEEHISLLQQLRTSGKGGNSMDDNVLVAGQDIVSKGLASLPSPSPVSHNVRSTVSSLMEAATPSRGNLHTTPSTVAAIPGPGPGPSHVSYTDMKSHGAKHPRFEQGNTSLKQHLGTPSNSKMGTPMHTTPVPPPDGQDTWGDMKYGLQRLEDGLKPQLSDMADLIEGLQKQNTDLTSAHIQTEKKVSDVISVLGHSLDIKAGEALRDQSELALARIDKVGAACEVLAQQVAILSKDMQPSDAPAGDMTSAFSAVDDKVNSLELALTDMAKKVGQALGKQEEVLKALQEAVTESRNEQEMIGIGAEKAVRNVQGQLEVINTKVNTVELDIGEKLEKSNGAALMDPSFSNKMVERIEVLEEGSKWARSRLEAVEVENAHTIQSQSSQRLKLDTLSKKLEELQASGNSNLELSVAECKATNAQLSEKVLSLEEKMPRRTESRMQTIEATLERQQASLMAWQVPVEEANTKAISAMTAGKKALANTDKLTQSVNNITAEWCEGLSALRPKIEELRTAAEGHAETKQRIVQLESKLSENGLPEMARNGEMDTSTLDTVLKQQQLVLSKIAPLVEEVNGNKATINALQTGLTQLQARSTDSMSEQFRGMEALQQQIKMLATELQKVSQVSDMQTDTRLYTSGTQSNVLNSTEGEREELAKELMMLRKETQEAHQLTNELRRRITDKEKETMTPASGYVSDDKMQHLMCRIDMLEEVLKRDQKASLIALEAILAERGQANSVPLPLQPHQLPSPSVTSVSRPVTPPPGQWEQSAPAVASPATARQLAMKEMESITHQILSSRGISVSQKPQGPMFGTPLTPTPGRYSNNKFAL